MNAASNNTIVILPPAVNTVSHTKEEPNPFEESFSSVTSKFTQYSPPKLTNVVDVWVSDTSSYTYDSNSINNDIFSVSDHQTISSTSEDDNDNYMNPVHSMHHRQPQVAQYPQQQLPVISYKFEDQKPRRHSDAQARYEHEQKQQQYHYQYQYQAQFINNNHPTQRTPKTKGKKRTRAVKVPEDEEKRKSFLERNRVAALKCRQRKKQWLNNLHARVEFLTNDNDELLMETDALHKEIMDLKTLLVAHKDCSQYNSNLSAQQHQVAFSTM